MPPKNSKPQIPNSETAEASVIACVLIHPKKYLEAASLLSADDFYFARHREIWNIFEWFHIKRRSFDYVIFLERAQQLGKIDAIGGKNYINKLAESSPSIENLGEYAAIVFEKALRRRIIQTANEFAKLGFQDWKSTEESIRIIEETFFELTNIPFKHSISPFKSQISELYDFIKFKAETEKKWEASISTGFNEVDEILGNLQPGNLIVVSSHPGQGKTSFLLSMLNNVISRSSSSVCYFSLEMPILNLLMRLISQKTRLETKRILQGKLLDEEWITVADNIGELSSWKVYVDDTPALSAFQIRNTCRRLHREFGLDLIIIDYIQLVQSDIDHDERFLELNEISLTLKILARELNIPVVVAAQLPYLDPTDKPIDRPASWVKGLEPILFNSDVVMLIQDEKTNEKITNHRVMTTLSVIKNRNGPVGSTPLIFRSDIAIFENL